MEPRYPFTVLENFVSPQDYATLCGVRVATVFTRFKHGHVAGIRISDKLFIDKETSPPIRNIGRKPTKAPAAKLPPDLPPVAQLICLIPWGSKHKQHVDDVLSDIIFGKVKAWGIGGQVVVAKVASVRNGKLTKTVRGR